MGVVWKAEDTRLHRQIAIKVLPRELATDPNRRARFEREARAVAALSHPIVVTLHSVERDGEIHFLTMELVDGEPCDHRSDIFSFGSILYEMSTGRRPFAGEGFTQVMSAILQDDPTPFAQIRTVRPEGLQKITLRCLEKDPNRRFQSAKELRDALEELRANPFSETHRFAGAK